MAKFQSRSPSNAQASGQIILNSEDLVGNWDWSIPADRVYADPYAAYLFGVDAVEAEAGVPLSKFTNGMHCDDRERVGGLIHQRAQTGGPFVSEYRVRSADGAIRWVLARGQFSLDHHERPLRSRGILIDITHGRAEAPAYVATAAFDDDPLMAAADHLIAAHKGLEAFGAPLLLHLSETLLFEVGRTVAKVESTSQRKRMN